MPAAAFNWPTVEKFLPATRAAANPPDKGEISMRKATVQSIIAAAVMIANLQFVHLASAQGRGQAQPAKPAAPAPPAARLPNGHPDLSGVWMGGGGIAARSLKKGDQILLTPEAKKIMEARQSKDDPEANCLPTGIPRMN